MRLALVRAAMGAVLALALTSACGGGAETSDATPWPGEATGTAPATASAAPTPASEARGTVVPRELHQVPQAEVAAGPEVVTVPIYEDGLLWWPSAAAGEGVVLTGSVVEPDVFGGDQHVLFDPATGSRRQLWTGEPGRAEFVGGSSGEWIATTTMGGGGLPFPDWAIVLRNWVTGEAREIAVADPTVVEYPGLHPGLPHGFAPWVAIRDGVVAWEEHFVHEDGVGKRVRRYEIGTGTATTLREIPDARLEDLRMPAVGGGTVAWVHMIFEDERAERADFVVELVDSSGDIRRLVLPGEPFQIELSTDGRTLYWATLPASVHGTDLDSLESFTLVSAIGSFVYVSGPYVGWAPYSATVVRAIGYYDERTRTRYMLTIDGGNERGGSARPLGKWFAWTVVVRDPEAGDDREASRIHFMPLD